MRLKSRLMGGLTLKEMAGRYKERLEGLSDALGMATSPRASLRRLSEGFWLRWAAKDAQVFGDYSIVPISKLSRMQMKEKDLLLKGCHGYRPAPERQGIAVLRDGKVVGAWEFERPDGTLRLVALSTDKNEQRRFIEENKSAMADAMFKVILDYCRMMGSEMIAYQNPNGLFRMMMQRFQKSEYIAAPEQTGDSFIHQILPDEWY